MTSICGPRGGPAAGMSDSVRPRPLLLVAACLKADLPRWLWAPLPSPEAELAWLSARLRQRNRLSVLEPSQTFDVPRQACTRRLGPAALWREIQRVQRRHEGPRRVLWTCGHVYSRTEPDLLGVIWLRYANGTQERIPLLNLPQTAIWDAGTSEDWQEAATHQLFERHVRPRLPASQAAQALKLSAGALQTAQYTELRDHPFTPGVREWYEMTTAYRVSVTTPDGRCAPAKLAQFRCIQTTTRVQVSGRRVLFLRGGQLWNISYGRLPQLPLSAEVRRGIQTLAWELAEAQLHPAELEALRALKLGAELEDLSLLLLAVRCPHLLSLPSLLRRVPWLAAREYRVFRQGQPTLKALLRQLCGALPRRITPLLASPACLAAAEFVHQSGFTSPDLKARVIEAVCVEWSAGVAPYRARWFVDWLGEEVAARRCITYFEAAGTVAHLQDLLRDSAVMWAVVQQAQPEALSRLRALGPQALHDELARLHRRIGQVNVPIPSAHEPVWARLEMDLVHETFGLLRFRRAAWTHELITVGELLNNCVASYAPAAVRGNVVLVVARDEAEQPRFCLEIRGGVVRQFKGNHNQSPKTPADVAVAEGYVRAARVQGGPDLRVRVQPLVLAGEADEMPF
jgi:hypothetical protein